MRYLSICSGIEAASVAWHGLGWEPVAFSEIEPFPSAVLAHHYPSVPNLGDMTNFKEWNLGTVDLLVGGTPCQSFSVAGLRKGLDDPRGNLMLTFLAIAERHRPRWIIWENVPGVLSSNKGRDFGTFLGALGELGYGWAYRVLDAQWFGVAQRRRRVFVVGCLGDQASAAAVLFESESVCRYSKKSGKARQGVARGVGGGVEVGVSPTLKKKDGVAVTQPVAFHPTQDPISSVDGTTHAMGCGSKQGTATVAVAHAFKIRGGVEREDGSRGSTNIGKQAGKGYLGSNELAFTVASSPDQYLAQPVAQPVAPALTASNDPSRSPQSSEVTQQVTAVHSVIMQVRRLTPVECERLQGFPDGFTNIPWRGKPESPDGPRYKALGNSMAVPCMKWIGERIQAATARQEVKP